MYRILLSFLVLLSTQCAYSEALTITHIKIKSSLLGKDRFLQHYLGEPGDIFNQENHERSLVRLKEVLVEDGYLDAIIKDTLIRDDQKNTLTVTLDLKQGSQFTISSIDFLVVGRPREKKALEASLNEQLGDFVGLVAQQKTLQDLNSKVRFFFMLKGYNQPQITIIKERFGGRNQLKITCESIVGKRLVYAFRGNTFFTDAHLRADISTLNEQGVSLPGSLIAHDIEELYRKKGFEEVRVEWQEGSEHIAFTIFEGPRYKVGRVTIHESCTDSEAFLLMQSLEKNLSALASYDEDDISALLKRATDDLSLLGYWHIMVTKKSIPVPAKRRLDVLVNVDQTGSSGGSLERTLITGVDIPDAIAGIEELLRLEPFASWRLLKKSRPLTPLAVDSQRRALLKFLRSKGYLQATVSHTLRNKRLVWSIDYQNGPVFFGPVKIAGLHKMHPVIVQRELCFREGDLWDPAKIDLSVERLKGLRMFESIALHPQSIGTGILDGESCTLRPILIKCCEDDPYELRTRFGLQFVSKSFTNLSWSTWKLGGSFIWKNPTGSADKVILDADWTRYTLNLAASYEVPWIGSLPIRTVFKVYSDRFDQPLISSNHHRLYKEAHDGASVTFNHLHPWWSTCVRFGFEVNTLSGISSELARVIDFEPKLVDKRTPYFYMEPSVTFEHFDDKAEPTKGYFTTLSMKTMVPPGVSDGWFVKAQLEQSFFYPLYPSVIGALRWRVGHIFNPKFSTLLPTERFYLGGANSLRGYETNMVPPLNDIICADRCLWVPVGGKTMVNVNAEVRFPLYKRLSGVLFTDMGILTQNRFADIAANRWLGATGFGLRLATPVGPIRFDIGWKWHKREPQDKSYAFFLTFGHAF